MMKKRVYQSATTLSSITILKNGLPYRFIDYADSPNAVGCFSHAKRVAKRYQAYIDKHSK